MGARREVRRRGRLFSRLLLSLLLLTVGCLPDPLPPSDPELRAELGIPDAVPIHRIDLSGRGDETRVLPTTTEASTGDVVQFVVLDHRVHLIRFDDERNRGDQLEFLRTTNQDRLPPLVERGARLVLTFEGAPTGVYYFRVEGNGPPVRGEIRVGELRSE